MLGRWLPWLLYFKPGVEKMEKTRDFSYSVAAAAFTHTVETG